MDTPEGAALDDDDDMRFAGDRLIRSAMIAFTTALPAPPALPVAVPRFALRDDCEGRGGAETGAPAPIPAAAIAACGLCADRITRGFV
jgi:hypothetical protein